MCVRVCVCERERERERKGEEGERKVGICFSVFLARWILQFSKTSNRCKDTKTNLAARIGLIFKRISARLNSG